MTEKTDRLLLLDSAIGMSCDDAQSETWQEDALRCMVRDGNRGAVQRQVGDGTSISENAGRGRLLLSVAARRGHKDLVEFFVQKGADVNEKGPGSGTALHAAVKNGFTEIATFLMENGADVKAAKCNGLTVLHLAARLGLRDIVSDLIQRKADVNAQDGDSWTALHEAARYGHSEVAELLIEAGAEVDAFRSDLFTPLHSAARYGHHKIAMALIKNGADVNAVRIGQWTPLLSAVHNHHTELAKDLIERGANVNDKNYALCTALHLAALHGHVGVVSTLIKNRADINATQDEGRTPLHLAAGNNRAEIVSLLIVEGADKDVLDKVKGWSAFHTAASSGHVESAMELLKSGARYDAKCKAGNTPLHSAVEKNHLEVVDGILKLGCIQILNEHNEIGLTPLHYACLIGSEEMMEKLLRAGASVDVKDDSGRTPMDFVKLNPPNLRDRLKNVFRRFNSDISEPERSSGNDIDLQSGQRTSATAREFTPHTSTDFQDSLPCSPGHSTAVVAHAASPPSSPSEEWSMYTPFGSRKQMLTRVACLVQCGYTFQDQHRIQPGCAGDKQHIRFLRETYGKKATLVVKFYHDEHRFENAKRIYDMIAGSDFICKAVKPLHTKDTCQPSGMVLKRGKITLTHWLQLQQQSMVDKRWCLHHALNGIKELHHLGIVHTNLTPSKIMFFPKVVWKLIGLDRARIAGREAVTAEATEYSAPELLRRSGDGGSSLLAQPSLDMWSFGVISYEVIAGDKLFGDVGDISSFADEIDNGKVRFKLEEIENTDLKELLTNLLETDPAERWTVDRALQSTYFRDDPRTSTCVFPASTEKNSD